MLVERKHMRSTDGPVYLHDILVRIPKVMKIELLLLGPLDHFRIAILRIRFVVIRVYHDELNAFVGKIPLHLY